MFVGDIVLTILKILLHIPEYRRYGNTQTTGGCIVLWTVSLFIPLLLAKKFPQFRLAKFDITMLFAWPLNLGATVSGINLNSGGGLALNDW